MAIRIQRSIGTGSLGLMWAAVADGELAALVAEAAETNGYDESVVREKLAAGRTIWLSHRDGSKLRGFDAAAEAAAAAAYRAKIAASRAADGYCND